MLGTGEAERGWAYDSVIRPPVEQVGVAVEVKVAVVAIPVDTVPNLPQGQSKFTRDSGLCRAGCKPLYNFKRHLVRQLPGDLEGVVSCQCF